MPMYCVTYGSMMAHYGPSFIEADSEYEARVKFLGTAFSRNEISCASARLVSEREIIQALHEKNSRAED